MVRAVLFRCHELKVNKAIVLFFPVEMMNIFILFEWSPKMAFHD